MYLKMHLVSCTNTHHDVTDLVCLKIKKLECLENGTYFFYKMKKLTYASDESFLEAIIFSGGNL